MVNRRDALKLGTAGMFAPSIGVAPGALEQRKASAQEQGGSVTMFRGNAARTGEMPGPGPSLDKPIMMKWRAHAIHLPSSPVVSDGVVYSPSGQLDLSDFSSPIACAFDAGTGEEFWRSSVDESAGSSPAIMDGAVYLGGERGNFYALDVSTGDMLWEFPLESSVVSSPAVVDGFVYFGCEDANLYALDLETGTERWRFKTNGAITYSSPAVVDEAIYIASEDSNLYAIKISTGQELWRFSTGDGISSTPAVVDNVVYIGSSDANIYAIDAGSGSELWRVATGGSVNSSPAVVDGTVYVGSTDNILYALDASTGKDHWEFATDGAVDSSPAVCQGTVYVGSGDGYLYAINAASGEELWRYKTGFPLPLPVESSPVVVDGMVFIVTNVSYVYYLEALGNPVETILEEDVVVRGGPSFTGVERGTAESGDVVSSVGTREEREGQMWAEVTIGDVTGWIPLDAIDPATLPPEGEIEYVYMP